MRASRMGRIRLGRDVSDDDRRSTGTSPRGGEGGNRGKSGHDGARPRRANDQDQMAIKRINLGHGGACPRWAMITTSPHRLMISAPYGQAAWWRIRFGRDFLVVISAPRGRARVEAKAAGQPP